MEDSMVDSWDAIRSRLKDSLGGSIFETWISPLKLKGANNVTLRLEAPDAFFKEWVERHYKTAIQTVCLEITKKGLSVEFSVAPSDQDKIVRTPAIKAKTRPIEQPGGLGLNSKYTFENFVVGPSNRFAHAYALQVAEAPAKAYNPLFIYGKVGLGKTHLMQGICHRVYLKFNTMKICYTTSERFTNELIDAIQHHSTHAFRQRYRSVDVLVIDDIHFIAGKESTQEEFFHTFNALYDAHKQIIISSDRPPKEIANLQERLVSRFSWGLTTDIQPPDFETRVAILKKKIEREPVKVPDDVLFFIAQIIKTNIRELEGALVRIIAYSLLEEKAIALDLAKEVLKDLCKEPKKIITVDFIQRCVSEEFGVALYDFKAKRRNKNVVLPRQVAMYLSRELTELSLPEIGNHFGGKDHTTVLHAYNKIKGSLGKDQDLQNRVNSLISIIQQ
ncbi:MAG: chromosomal replication initiator protein DnaA [Candidatus Omnitrophota bacterium]|nr:MAG: chromosomal replication initiator protein DnaA [Candidatus Omnitrophota bacterium]